MAHKSVINGTVYEKYGGTDLIEGTVYAKNYGKTLIGGMAYEVGFAPSEATVTITGDRGNTTITINGVTYYGDTTVVVPIGTVITCYADNDENSTSYGIYLNGVHVALTTYAYTITCNVHIETREGRDGGYVFITEIPEGHALMTVEEFPSWSTSFGSFSVSYEKADGTYTNVSAKGNYAVPIGGTIAFDVKPNKGYSGYIYVNDNLVASKADASINYSYTLTGNITVVCQSHPTSGNIYITET